MSDEEDLDLAWRDRWAPDQPLVLVVDDEVLIRNLLTEALVEAGFGVCEAATAGEARRILHTLAGNLFALVVEVNLDGAAAGWDLGRAARRAAPGAAVIYMNGDSADQRRNRGVAGSQVMNKPFRPDDLIRQLSALLGQPGHA